MNQCGICKIWSNKRFRRGFCCTCYEKGLNNGSIQRIIKPILPQILTSDQKSILVGSMLGDGNLSLSSGKTDARLNIGRSEKDIEYLKWEFNYFKDFCLSGIKYRTFFDKRYNKYYKNVNFSTRISPLITHYYNTWYPNGKKIVPGSINDELSPLAIAVWFMDDGSVMHSRNHKYRLKLQLCTNSFSKEEVEFLISILEKRYNEQFLLTLNSKKQPIIHAGDNATRAFISEIDAYIPEAMLRKSNKWRLEENRFYKNKPKRTYYKINRINKLNGTELNLLSLIRDNPNFNSKQLLNLAEMKKSNLHVLLQKFEKLKYVSVNKTPPTKGGNYYLITQNGIDKIKY